MAAFTSWDTRSRYTPPCSCGCEHESECTCNKTYPPNTGCKECSCCPPGMVEFRDESGKVLSCVTPNDYQGLMITSYKCPDGYIKVSDADGNFLGCLDMDQYAAWKTLNP